MVSPSDLARSATSPNKLREESERISPSAFAGEMSRNETEGARCHEAERCLRLRFDPPPVGVSHLKSFTASSAAPMPQASM